jgi:hypothetical protein
LRRQTGFDALQNLSISQLGRYYDPEMLGATQRLGGRHLPPHSPAKRGSRQKIHQLGEQRLARVLPPLPRMALPQKQTDNAYSGQITTTFSFEIRSLVRLQRLSLRLIGH